MEPAFIHLEQLTMTNTSYRKVISTNAYSQLVVMSLEAEEEIPLETHPYTSQFIRIEEGTASITIGEETRVVKDGDCVLIPPGVPHRVRNYSNGTLKLYTIYSPPHHPRKLEHRHPTRFG